MIMSTAREYSATKAGVNAMFYILIWEMLGSNIGLNTGYTD
jgi:NAD(P)-dependent dehydrogenase (short-subunit alcohol dehydrogenase family)